MSGATSTYYEWSKDGDVTAGSESTKTYSNVSADTSYKIGVRARYSVDGLDVYTGWVTKVFTTPAVE